MDESITRDEWRRCRLAISGTFASGFVLPLLFAACAPAPPPEAAPPVVSVAQALPAMIVESPEFPARLAAVDTVEIRPRVSGVVQSVNFVDGATVQSGDLLYVIDTRPYAAELARASAELARAKSRLDFATSDVDRAARLIKNAVISEAEFDSRRAIQRDAAAALEAAQATVEARRLDMEFTHVRAPISGRLGRNFVTEGNLVSHGSAGSIVLTTIVALDPIHVYFDVDERTFLGYARLSSAGGRPNTEKPRDRVRVGLTDESGFPHEGHIDFIDNRLDPETGTITLRAVLPNPDGILAPGLFARVKIIGETETPVLLVPDGVIGTDQADRFVLVLGPENRVKRRRVKPGTVHRGLRAILKGIEAEDWVVISGLQRVRPEMSVNPERTTIELGKDAEPGTMTAGASR